MGHGLLKKLILAQHSVESMHFVTHNREVEATLLLVKQNVWATCQVILKENKGVQLHLSDNI